MPDAADTPQGQQQPQSQQSQGAQSASTPVMRSDDTAVGQQQQLGQLQLREADAAALYNTTLRYFRTVDTFPTLAQNLREYLAGRMSDEMTQSVDQYCTVEEYLRQPATYCADEQVRQRIDAMPGMHVARDLLRMVDAGYATVGSWAEAGMPRDVTGVSALTYNYLQSTVDAAAARAAQRRRVEPASPKDKYRQTCEQLLPADVGKALYASVRDATWGALRYVTGAAAARVPFATDTDSETALPASVNDRGVKHASGDIHDAQEARRNEVVLYTLYSERGWPTMWGSASKNSVTINLGALAAIDVPQANEREALADNVVNRMLLVHYEMQRAWQRVVQYYNSINTIDTLDTRPHDKQPFTPPQRQDDSVRGRVLSSTRAMSRLAAALVVGTPGIGKTTSGNYMVYRLLHDANAPRYVVFAVDNRVYVFDKQRECVSCYERAAFDKMGFCMSCGEQCVYIHDCSASKYQLDAGSYFDVALLIVLSSPNKENYDKFFSKALSKAGFVRVVMHSWSYCELSCYTRLVDVDDKTLQERVRRVGPLPRYVMKSTDAYERRAQAVDEMTKERIATFNPCSVGVADALLSTGRDAVSPTNTLYDMRRGDAQHAQQHDRRRNAADVSGDDDYTYRLLTRDMHQRLLDGVLSRYSSRKAS